MLFRKLDDDMLCTRVRMLIFQEVVMASEQGINKNAIVIGLVVVGVGVGCLLLPMRLGSSNLTVAKVEQYLDLNRAAVSDETTFDTLDFRGYRSIEDDAAELLADQKGALLLDGLRSLSDVGASRLAKFEGTLELSGLTEVSDAVLEALSEHEGALRLNGLTALSDTGANALARHNGELGLNGVTELSDSAAQRFSEFHSTLQLYGLTSISAIGAENLAKNENVYLDSYSLPTGIGHTFRGIREPESVIDSVELVAKEETPSGLASMPDISFPGDPVAKVESVTRSNSQSRPEASQPLSKSKEASAKVLTVEIVSKFPKHNFMIHLSEYTSIEQEAAEVLSTLQGELYLDGLETLTDAAAESLSKHRGFILGLNGLTELSDAQAESLSKHRGITLPPGLPAALKLNDEMKDSMLVLDGLTTLSDEGARSLAKKQGKVYVDHDKIPPSASKILKDAGH